jgi:serine/threonine protein kinase
MKILRNTIRGETVREAYKFKLLKEEIATLQLFNHQNIIRVHDVKHNSTMYWPNSKKKKQTTFIALELAEYGELFDFISLTGKFPETIARALFRQLLEGLFACYQHGVTHRDLKPENILVGRDFKLKIADFGFSTFLNKHKDDKNVQLGKLQTQAGTESYMAPEIHLGLDYNGATVDLFSAAIILFVMVTGCPPFEYAKPADDFYKCLCTNKHKTFWESHLQDCDLSPEFIDLMNTMLAFDPNQRLSIGEIIKHPWMQKPVPSDSDTRKELERRWELIKAQQELDNQRDLQQE